MSEDRCPFCGSGHKYATIGWFDCGSMRPDGKRSETCYKRQLAILQDELIKWAERTHKLWLDWRKTDDEIAAQATEVRKWKGLAREMIKVINDVGEAIYVSSMPNHIRDRRKQLYDYILQLDNSIQKLLDSDEVRELLKEKKDG